MARELEWAAAEGHAVCKITCPSTETAERLASALIERRAAACVNIIPGISSVYHWKGEICRDSEVLLLAKTRLEKSEHLLKIVEEIHPYEVPEVLWTAVTSGSKSYLDWLSENLR